MIVNFLGDENTNLKIRNAILMMVATFLFFFFGYNLYQMLTFSRRVKLYHDPANAKLEIADVDTQPTEPKPENTEEAKTATTEPETPQTTEGVLKVSYLTRLTAKAKEIQEVGESLNAAKKRAAVLLKFEKAIA